MISPLLSTCGHGCVHGLPDAEGGLLKVLKVRWQAGLARSLRRVIFLQRKCAKISSDMARASYASEPYSRATKAL